jgi:hypothetical protein
MLEETLEKRQAGEGHPAELLGPIVPIPKGDLPVLDPFETAVGDGDPEDVAAQVVEDLLAVNRTTAKNPKTTVKTANTRRKSKRMEEADRRTQKNPKL